MMPALAGLAMGIANQVPVLLAGGTQMTAVLALINALNPEALCNIAVGTTRWVTNDATSDIRGIIDQFCKVPILAADLNFGNSKFPGLQIYETGLVKEGVGAGGSSIAAMAKMGDAVNKELLLKAIERNYSVLMSMK
jgi:NaMN:DMB phosphoribosyltransferase